jgi:hypothetical protein
LKAAATLTTETVARSAVAFKIITPLEASAALELLAEICNHAVIAIDDFS